jgi:serine/threonine protein phosphatase PrpC
MGGHHAGDVASTSIVEALTKVTPNQRLSEFVEDIENKLIEVNRNLRQMAAEHKDNRTIGSTIVSLITMNQHCAIMWAGDSRAYRLRNGGLVQLTRDHSQVEEMVEHGLLQPEDAESHPASNVITRAVGASDVLYIDVHLHDLEQGDVFLLCSDGLYKHISAKEIGTILGTNAPLQEIAQKFINTTLERGATDNVTVVAVKID